MANDVVARHEELGCPVRCQNVEFQYTNSNLGTNTHVVENKTSFWPMFNRPYVTIEEEYLLFDTVAIISATGGSLGLFLGLSCYNVIWTAFERVEAFYNRIRAGEDRQKIDLDQRSK